MLFYLEVNPFMLINFTAHSSNKSLGGGAGIMSLKKHYGKLH